MNIPDLKQKTDLLVRWQTRTEAGNKTMELFDWPQGVALFALYLHAREAGDAALMDYLYRWFDTWIDKGLPGKNVNSMAPMLTLSFLYEDTKKESYLKICEEWLHYIMVEHPRTGEEGFQHKTIDSENYAQLWDDTLYVAVLFIARMGRLLKRDDCVQESIRQFLVHIKYLSDPVTGLFFHGWTFQEKHHFSGALWGRGNAWYTAGLVDYLELAEIPGGVKMFLVSTLRRQIDALQAVQADNGMFHTLLDDPGSYQEASATAGFAYGILKAVRLGLLPESYREAGEKAAAAVAARVLPSGELQEVSAGTCLRMSKDYYRNIPLRPCPYGQSMALLALVEAGKS